MYLLDTCVFSEFSKKEPSPRVSSWSESVSQSEIYLSVLVLGELLRGVAKLPEGFRKHELRHWVETLFVSHRSRLVLVETDVIRTWAEITVKAETQGKPAPAMDSLIAASALAHNLTLVTRNTEDFERLGVSLHNPWN